MPIYLRGMSILFEQDRFVLSEWILTNLNWDLAG